eukprot:Tamp_17875.p1 GENE.Tamp_17875~~Tamp_17875.p1  ORF type:complete len:413 (+),score=37.15 Tamp_17875:85-1323(+)
MATPWGHCPIGCPHARWVLLSILICSNKTCLVLTGLWRAMARRAGGFGEPTRGENAPSTPGVPRCAFAPPLPPRVRRAGTMRRLAAFPTRGPRGALRPAPSGPALSLRASAASSARDERDAMDLAAAKVQRWLEDVYEAVDYEAALVRAGVLDPADLLPAAESAGPDEGKRDVAGAAVGPDSAVEDADLEEMMRLTDGVYLPMDVDMTIDHFNSNSASASGDICEGKEGELTYGEMDLAFFLSILKYLGPPNGRKFVDVGCGRGQLVLAAGVLGGWGSCEGIELMSDILEIGRGALDVVRGPGCPALPRVGKGGADGFAHCRLHLGDMYRDTEPLRDADVVLAYATCFATDDGVSLSKLSQVFAASCKSGATVITVNKRLKEEDGFTLVDTLQGRNPDSVAYEATAFIWRAP